MLNIVVAVQSSLARRLMPAMPLRLSSKQSRTVFRAEARPAAKIFCCVFIYN